MEIIIHFYIDRLFEGLEKNFLASRYGRQILLNFLSGIIKSCAEAEKYVISNVYEHFVTAMLQYHEISIITSGSFCLLDKYHNILYIAVKACYDWKLDNSLLVNNVLNNIFLCEKTFERLISGAIFCTKVTHYLCGWKSDFNDQEENMKALLYFLDHAINGRLEYTCVSPIQSRRFIDVPMKSYGQMLPLCLTIRNGSFETLHIMLRYGATIYNDIVIPSPIDVLLSRINEFERDVHYPQELIICLQLFMRALPNICVDLHNQLNINYIKNIRVYDKYPNLTNCKLIPPERSGLHPPELKHLCRCRIRQCLFTNWALPQGIRKLQIPEILQDYIDLLVD